MKLVKAIINNYKSFGEEENVLYVSDLNVIIGKNESGKSNLLECFEDIGYIGISNDKLYDKNNRKSDKKVTIKLMFETIENESFFYEDYNGKVTVVLENKNDYRISEEFGNYIVNLKEYKIILEEIKELSTIVPINKTENRKNMQLMIEAFENVNEKIFVKPDFYDSFIKVLKSTQDKSILRLLELFESMIFMLDNVYLNFPNFISIVNEDLKNIYTLAELENELEEFNYNSILYQLFKICNIDSTELLKVMKTGDYTKIRTCTENVENSINNIFVEEFNKYYSQEKIYIAVNIQKDSLCFMIKSTTGAYLRYTERSNGFKWYISIFTQLLYKRKTSGNFSKAILILDEPGVYLHANAQRELQKLLHELANKGEQIIYTTHSPFMINSEDFMSIRALVKDKDGYTRIYNKITTIPNIEESKYETITPILYALGSDEAYNIGPSFSKCNIITEGITDYYCLVGYNECIENKEKYRILPCTGANNVIAVATILFGWGYDFIILLDQDDKGRSVYKSLKDSNMPFLNKVVFANSSQVCDPEIDFEIENVFSDADRSKFSFKSEDYEDKKYNYVTDMLAKIKCKEERYDDLTIENFNKLFENIEKINADEI